MKFGRRLVLAVSIAALCSTGACKREAPVEEVGVNNTEEIPLDEGAVNAVEAPLPPANLTEPVKAASPPEVSDEVQMRDDADATGLTARLPEDGPSGGENQTQPAE